MIIYGWTKEYILRKVSLKQFSLYYKLGYRFDMERRGFKFNKSLDEDGNETWEDLRKLYYSPEQREKQEEMLKNKYGGVE